MFFSLFSRNSLHQIRRSEEPIGRYSSNVNLLPPPRRHPRLTVIFAIVFISAYSSSSFLHFPSDIFIVFHVYFFSTSSSRQSCLSSSSSRSSSLPSSAQVPSNALRYSTSDVNVSPIATPNVYFQRESATDYNRKSSFDYQNQNIFIYECTFVRLPQSEYLHPSALFNYLRSTIFVCLPAKDVFFVLECELSHRLFYSKNYECKDPTQRTRF